MAFGASKLGITKEEMKVIASVFNTAVAADTDILTNDWEVDENCILRIAISENTGVIFKVKITRNTTEKIFSFYENITLRPDSSYYFDILAKKGDKINFRVSANTTINRLDVFKSKE